VLLVLLIGLPVCLEARGEEGKAYTRVGFAPLDGADDEELNAWGTAVASLAAHKAQMAIADVIAHYPEDLSSHLAALGKKMGDLADRETLQAAGKRAGIRWIVRGRLRREGKELLVSAWLLDVDSGKDRLFLDERLAGQDVLDLPTLMTRRLAKAFDKEPKLREGRRQVNQTEALTFLGKGYYAACRAKASSGARAEQAWGEARQWYEKAVKADPESSVALTGLAGCFIVMGDIDARLEAEYNARAEQLLAKAIKLDPEYAPSHSRLGNALEDKGNLDGAIEACRKAIELDPKSLTAYNNMGVALKTRGDLDEAAEAYEKAIELDPKWAGAYVNLGNVLRVEGKLTDAIELHRKAIELDPRLAAAYTCLGNALRANGSLTEAIEAHRKAVELAPKLAAAHNNLGIALKQKGDLAEAIEACEKGLELDPESTRTRENLENARKALKNKRAAQRQALLDEWFWLFVKVVVGVVLFSIAALFFSRCLTWFRYHSKDTFIMRKMTLWNEVKESFGALFFTLIGLLLLGWALGEHDSVIFRIVVGCLGLGGLVLTTIYVAGAFAPRRWRPVVLDRKADRVTRGGDILCALSQAVRLRSSFQEYPKWCSMHLDLVLDDGREVDIGRDVTAGLWKLYRFLALEVINKDGEVQWDGKGEL